MRISPSGDGGGGCDGFRWMKQQQHDVVDDVVVLAHMV